ncbi:Ribokinase [Gimesia panareensis]|uniref:Ribokinase n=1 Tax=Gimesia panareensis TaxID=2527978 RepID=A0A518FKY1_9PLAN|nr:ribokinase [Gimesia panareensis]QDV16949.1 Ribokinase [Gimesia panareensis]
MSETRRARIAVLGSINMDLMIRSAKLPLPGETVIADAKVENPGGKGANQAVAAARMGAEVTMIGCVGDDSFAEELVQNLEAEGVQTQLVSRKRETTSGVAMVMVETSGENAILVVPGANGLVGPTELGQARQVICDSDVLLMQLEVPVETVIAAAAIAREAGVPVILDPAPAPAHFPAELLDVDLICPNQSEAAALLGQSVGSVDEAVALVPELAQQGPRRAIITLADQGAVLFDGERVETVAAFEVDAVDSTAAGDAFAAGLAVRLAEQADLKEAVRFASAAGALAASGAGAQSAMPTREQIETLLTKQ